MCEYYHGLLVINYFLMRFVSVHEKKSIFHKKKQKTKELLVPITKKNNMYKNGDFTGIF